MEILSNFSFENLLNSSRAFNSCFSILAILVGLVGNSLALIEFWSRRKISNYVYLITLALNDSIFLLVHFFEDTLRAHNFNIYLVDLFNFVDKYDLGCRLVNFIRYMSRFVSAYVLVAHAIGSVLLKKKWIRTLKRRKSVCILVSVIAFISIMTNIWTLFTFKLRKNEKTNTYYCGLKENFTQGYFLINIVYIVEIMIIPVCVLCLINSMALFKLKPKAKVPTNIRLQSCFNSIRNKEDSEKANFSLVVISLFFIILNLPYLISWIFYFIDALFRFPLEFQIWLLAALKLSEAFYILNYSLKYYIYKLSLFFRNRLDKSKKLKSIKPFY